MTDYYALLGLGPGATKDQIKEAYRRLAMRFHPDRNGGSNACEERLKEINKAYEVLGHEAQRRRYDALTGHQPHHTILCQGKRREPSSVKGFGPAVHQGGRACKLGRCKRRIFTRGGCAKQAWPI
jgi:curved DNA-binding protein CbpA